MGKYVHISKQIHTHTYIKLSHFAVYLKLALHCQLTVLQLKKQLQKLKGEVPWWSRWLGLGASTAVGWVQSVIRELRFLSYVLQPKKKKIKNRNTDYKM